VDALSSSLSRIGEAVYGAAGADGAAPGGGFDPGAEAGDQGRGSAEGTVEGEFREV
jgi:hypothetical protein